MLHLLGSVKAERAAWPAECAFHPQSAGESSNGNGPSGRSASEEWPRWYSEYESTSGGAPITNSIFTPRRTEITTFFCPRAASAGHTAVSLAFQRRSGSLESRTVWTFTGYSSGLPLGESWHGKETGSRCIPARSSAEEFLTPLGLSMNKMAMVL